MDPPECSGHSHDHEHADDLGQSLRTYIDFSKVMCLNEETTGSGKAVLKLHEERLSAEPSLRSPEDDPELLLHIPFTEAVSIQSFTIRNGSTNAGSASPRKIKLFVNQENMGFETAREMPPEQELELLPPDHFAEGTIDYPVRPAGKFKMISSLTIFVVNNYGGDDDDGGGGRNDDDDHDHDDDDDDKVATEITFVGLKGKGSNIKRVAVETVYEAQGMRKDHKVPGGELGGHSFV